MKKILSLIMAVIMLFPMAVLSLAETIDYNSSLSLTPMSSQIRFNRENGSSYSETFDIRTRAQIFDDDFAEYIASTNYEAEQKIEKAGFVYTLNSEKFEIADAQAVAKGEKKQTYVDAPVNVIWDEDGYYMFSCTITNIPAEEKEQSITAYAYICIDGEWFFFETGITTDFSQLYDKFYSLDCFNNNNKVNENKSIILSSLPADTYTLRYEDANGIMTDYEDICSLTIINENETVNYDGFIEENCAPIDATTIGVYNSSDVKVGDIKLNSLEFSVLGEKKYSFAAISDTHVGARTAADDLQKALTYFENDEDIQFTTICGDLSLSGSETNLSAYKNIVETYATKPVYAITGNHEAAGLNSAGIESIKDYTDYDLCYSFNIDEDVYIMMGIKGYSKAGNNPFLDGSLQWLSETLEANKDKRCFLFMHFFPEDGSGDAVDLDKDGEMLDNKQGEVFYSLISHYSNVIWFHSHSHQQFAIQEINAMNNYDDIFGCHSIHIPSLAYPKYISDGKLISNYDASEGYIVDVYENNVVLRGRDFVSGKFLPIASYSLDTTIKSVEANTYYDPTGTVVNSNSNILKSGSTWYNGSVDKSTITKITFADVYTETEYDESWDASISENGKITVYRTGTELTVVGNENGIRANSNSVEMFSGFKNLTEIANFELLDTSNITDMNGMFKNCSKLTTLNLSGFDGVEPANMMNVFSGCNSLQSIDISNFDLRNVKHYTNLFYNCNSLSYVNLGDDAAASQMSVYCYGMYSQCSSLIEIDMTVFSGKNINLGAAFDGCISLKKVKFGQNKLLAFTSTFTDCVNLEELDISSFDISNVDNMNKTFEDCQSLKTLILPETFDTSKVTTMKSTFKNCPLLVLDCSGWDTTSLTDISSFNDGSQGVTAPIILTS